MWEEDFIDKLPDDPLLAGLTICEKLHTFNNRKNFPQDWAGLRDEELQKVTQVSDAIFCHRGLFLAVAKSKEGAIALAEKALVESS